jgi:hypothetical protein
MRSNNFAIIFRSVFRKTLKLWLQADLSFRATIAFVIKVEV